MRDDNSRYQDDTRLSHQPPRRKRRKSSGRFFLYLLLGLAALIFFAPTIALKTELRNKLIPWAVPDFAGKVAIGSASGTWFSPLELNDVTVWDADGQPIARFPRITSTKKLSSWISDQHNLGAFELFNPEIQLTLANNSSNIEKLIEPFMEPVESSTTTEPANPIPIVSATITDGRVLVTDKDGGQDCTIENLQLQLQTPESAPAPISVNLKADALQGAQRGQLATQFNWLPPSAVSAADLGDGTLTLISNGFPLTALQPVLRRAESDLNMTGQMTANVDCRWKRSQTGPAIEAQGNVTVAQPHMRMPSVLGTDELNLTNLTAKLDVVSAENQFQVRSIEVNSDVATLTVVGQAELTDVMSDKTTLDKLLDWQSSHQFQVHGQVDVAAVAAQLPTTLSLREGTNVTQGQIDLDIDSRMELGSRVLRGTVKTNRIAATTGGKTVTWDEPVSLAFGGVSSANGLEIKQLNCTSDFLVVNANGTLEQGQLTATGDLRRLANQLHQFCDLGQLQMNGSMATKGGWQRGVQDQCRLRLQTVVNDFALSSESIPPVAEKQMTLTADVTGKVTNKGVEQLNNGQLQIVSGEDQMVANLTRAVPQPDANSVWPLDCNVTGHTESWLARLKPWGVSVDGWDVRANVNATANGDFHAEKIALSPCTIRLTNLSAKSDGWLVREPELQLQANCNWQAAGNQVTAPSFTLISHTVTARGQDLAFAATEQDMRATGQLAFRGDLARMYGWQYSATPPTQTPQGTFEGQASVSTENGVIAFETTADVNQFAWLQRSVPAGAALGTVTNWAPVWQEPKVQVATKGNYVVAEDKLTLAEATVTSSSVALGAQGELAQVSATPAANLHGQLTYDLAAIAARFQNQLGPNIKLVGQRTAPFQLQGPLMTASLEIAERPAHVGDIQQMSAAFPVKPMVPPDLTGQAKLGWDAIEAYGVKLGPQEINTQLTQGTVLFSPLQTTLAEGTITLQPRVELNANPMALVIDEGTVAEGINITPEMCSSWFQYITPILAGAATADGKMSIDMKGARVPLTDPTKGSFAGTIRIAGAKVQPGPLAQQLLGTVTELAGVVQRNAPSLNFLAQGENWLELQPQNVEFQMVEGKVYHRNLELTSGNVTVRTQGWVGVDQSVGMMAEIPILDDWVDGEKYLAGLKGESIKIPIHGSLSKPQLDRRAIGQLSRQLVSGTAEKLLQQEVQKGLQKGLQKLLGQ